jgi:hypothetical protein
MSLIDRGDRIYFRRWIEESYLPLKTYEVYRGFYILRVDDDLDADTTPRIFVLTSSLGTSTTMNAWQTSPTS